MPGSTDGRSPFDDLFTESAKKVDKAVDEVFEAGRKMLDAIAKEIKQAEEQEALQKLMGRVHEEFRGVQIPDHLLRRYRAREDARKKAEPKVEPKTERITTPQLLDLILNGRFDRSHDLIRSAVTTRERNLGQDPKFDSNEIARQIISGRHDADLEILRKAVTYRFATLDAEKNGNW